MTVKVCNKHFHTENIEQDLYIARPTIFGNPWCHIQSEGITKTETREEAIERYIPYFLEQYKTNQNFKETVDAMVEMAKQSDVNLVCWCSPKPCHGDIIKKFIEYKLRR